LINRRYTAAFNQFYGVEARTSPVWTKHPESSRHRFMLGLDSTGGVTRDAMDHIDPPNHHRARHGMSVSSNCTQSSRIRICFSSRFSICRSFLRCFALDMDRERLQDRTHIFRGLEVAIAHLIKAQSGTAQVHQTLTAKSLTEVDRVLPNLFTTRRSLMLDSMMLYYLTKSSSGLLPQSINLAIATKYKKPNGLCILPLDLR
jgi:hypothetical protein